jgi:hypothetical protein
MPRNDNPREYFDDRYEDAVKFYKRHQRKILNIIDEYDGDSRLVMSVGFPELVRYSMWKDYLETKYNEIRYVNKGKPGSYFSIGMFQIKPFFVEKLEKTLKEDSLLYKKYPNIVINDSISNKQQRQERINRLKSWQWQIRYITIFTHIVINRYNLANTMQVKEKIAFLSSAYNHSFTCDSTEVIEWRDKKTFPYGIKRDNPFSYATVAIYFYQHDYLQFEKK